MTHKNTISILVGESLEYARYKLLIATLEMHRGDKKLTAKTLGVTWKTVYNMMTKFGLHTVHPHQNQWDMKK